MVIFPAWLLHQVRPYRGNAERISIAFNLTVRAAPIGRGRSWLPKASSHFRASCCSWNTLIGRCHCACLAKRIA
jgi:hypothetical protein